MPGKQPSKLQQRSHTRNILYNIHSAAIMGDSENDSISTATIAADVAVRIAIDPKFNHDMWRTDAEYYGGIRSVKRDTIMLKARRFQLEHYSWQKLADEQHLNLVMLYAAANIWQRMRRDERGAFIFAFTQISMDDGIYYIKFPFRSTIRISMGQPPPISKDTGFSSFYSNIIMPEAKQVVQRIDIPPASEYAGIIEQLNDAGYQYIRVIGGMLSVPSEEDS